MPEVPKAMTPSAPALKPLFKLTLPPSAAYTIGTLSIGERRVGLVSDAGTFVGERLRGTILPGGADWILVRPDEVVTLDVRAVLETDDKALIAFTYRGLRHGPAAVMERLARGDPVDPSEYYMRIMGSFETAAPRYAWLNRIFAIGTGRRPPTGAVYEVFELA